MKLTDREWKEFHLHDLFKINSGNKFDKSKMTSGSPSVNFIGRASTNNGITAYVDEIDGIKPYNSGYLTVALGGSYLGSCFVQEAPFYTSQNVAVLIPLHTMCREVKLFISHLIRNESVNNYVAFARELNAHIRRDFIIKLPIMLNGEPDFQFVKSYMASLDSDISSIPDYFLDEGYNKACWYMDNIDQNEFKNKFSKPFFVKKSIELDNVNWKPFKLGDCVNEIYKAASYKSSELTPYDGDDALNYVTRSEKNNGITQYVVDDNLDKKEAGNAITVGDTTASIFYQPKDFVAGEHIVVIRADWFNKYTAIFLVTLLRLEKYRYPVYGRAFTKNLIYDTIILFPINDYGQPNYQLMEDYIKSLSFSCNI